jgi:hypothetical protein
MKKLLTAVFIIAALILVTLFIRNFFVYTPQYHKAVAVSEVAEVFSALGKLEGSLLRFWLENNNDCSEAAFKSLDITVPTIQNYSFAIDQKNCAVTATKFAGNASGTVFTRYVLNSETSCSGDTALCAIVGDWNKRDK